MEEEYKLYNKIIKNNSHVVLFGLSTCGYCKAALNYLKNKEIPFKFYNIKEYYGIFFKILQNVIKNHPELGININHRTIPVIFANGKFIGGYNDLIKIL